MARLTQQGDDMKTLYLRIRYWRYYRAMQRHQKLFGKFGRAPF
jgi:hypothetical protein